MLATSCRLFTFMHNTMERSPQSLTIFRALVSKLSASEAAAADEARSANRHTNLSMFAIVFFRGGVDPHNT